ncbi:peptidoglycan hydrolase CwlO-like protein [Kibdelosporangium banguiense]|uniref:Peptidoglycan hydrolase CwlO-like protein n=1 Tax=Kibdelosporangium banguiense TaxID=1365924 RepID=A0ABS4THM7_9PSEU|nr:hypothetical protein [Kibdelosporangium banguiense]MBP2323363.1 peptidoglycan hydrolase CwlO-like protein [Kibdelosporangium banguiense]
MRQTTTDPNGQPDPGAEDPNGKNDGTKSDETPKSVEEQLAELTAKFEDLKTNSRKWETRAKENKKAAEELDQIKAQGMTPDQKLQAAEDKASKAERELARYKVAAETGVPAALLHGGDEDAMRESAKAALEFRGTAPKSTAPKPDPSQGGTGTTQKPSAREAGLDEARRRFKKS